MSDGVEIWIIYGLPGLMVLVALVSMVVRRAEQKVARATRERWFWLVAVLLVPGVFWGDAKVMAALGVVNLTIGRWEFIPFSRFPMFSALPDRHRIVFLADDNDDRINAATVSNLHNHEINKLFQNARSNSERQNPDWAADGLDSVGAYFVNEAIIRTAAQRGLGVPAGVRIMLAEISHGSGEPVVEERELRRIGLEE